MAETPYVRVLPEADLAVGSRQVVTVEGKQVLLCNPAGKIHAVSNICSHADEKLETGMIRAGWVACPVHGARFDLLTGKAKNPPAKAPIAVYPVRIEDGWIEVQV